MKAANVMTLMVLLMAVTSACGASPEEVCAKQAELIKKAGGEAPSDADLKKCESSMEKKKEMKGIFGYREFANCIMDAESLEATEKCK
ncbi:MAG: hypothetical protein RBU37_17160 [Myxococcota bacterium]|jgi:hypothetical protein|nr:hypothetical protein [Myxococcota bacterium]